MAKIAFTFSYQNFTRYVQNMCDSGQEVDGSRFKEEWLYDRMKEYLEKHASRSYEFEWEQFAPREFQSGVGGPRRFDLVGYTQRSASTRTVGLVMEAKLMINDRSSWAQEIISDLIRVASVREFTTRKTRRYVLVVGQERCWQQALGQADGLLSKMCPLDRARDPHTLWLTRKSRQTELTTAWQAHNEKLLDKYLFPLLPPKIKIVCVGYCKSNRGADEQPEAGMTARLWRVYPQS